MSLHVAIIVGSTRPGRKSESVARWIHESAQGRDDAIFEIVDLDDCGLPLLDEPQAARSGVYANAYTRAWSERIGAFDAFIFVTPEYNGSIPGVLKNAIDFLYHEWCGKVAAFVGYGYRGGARAIDHLRQVMNDLTVIDVPTALELCIFEDFKNHTLFVPRAEQSANLDVVLDELIGQSALAKPGLAE
ncbi:NADPH-dependent FMN reductase [Nocardia sp. NPDC059246]|uniref:NADPH-dependent FMN reductase n=1 Tax=unclassified Nocardia TaxID=2637762 RepID=UPI0036B7B00F